MTAEERMTYFQKGKSKKHIYSNKNGEKNYELIFLKIKFLIAVILFIIFLSLDYTGYRIKGIGSEEIIGKVTTDQSLEILDKIAL